MFILIILLKPEAIMMRLTGAVCRYFFLMTWELIIEVTSVHPQHLQMLTKYENLIRISISL